MLNKLRSKRAEVTTLICVGMGIIALSGVYSLWYSISNPDWEPPLTTEQVLKRHKL